jgi:hypothetical protein
MDTERKTCHIRTWGKNVSRHILNQHLYTCLIALPVRRNPQHRSLLTVPHFRFNLFVLETVSRPSCESL